MIVPSWLDEPIGADEVALRLDPGMAFGTGLHPTTRGCLTLLQEISPMPARVLDVGSGSGILGWRRFAGRRAVVAIDTDPLAVEATPANAAANGLADRLSVRQGTLHGAPAEPFPLVLANLVAAVLIELAPRLAAHMAPGGTLLASGIIEERADEVEAALAAAGLQCAERRDRRGVGLAAHAAGVTLHRFFVAPDAMRGDRFPLPEAIAHQVTPRPAAAGRRPHCPA